VNFQSFNSYLAGGVGSTTYSFALNLGIYLLTVPPDAGREPKQRNDQICPDEWQCHLRLHPQRGLDQPELPRRDIWYIDPHGAYLASAVHDARRVIANTGLPWFDKWTDERILNTLLTVPAMLLDDGTELPGRAGAPSRNYVAGYLARGLKQYALAVGLLSEALKQYHEIDARNATLMGRWFKPMTPPRLSEDVTQLRAAV
jgi:hypothetical protein